MKNELILASKPDRIDRAASDSATNRLQRVLAELGLDGMAARFGVIPA